MCNTHARTHARTHLHVCVCVCVWHVRMSMTQEFRHLEQYYTAVTSARNVCGFNSHFTCNQRQHKYKPAVLQYHYILCYYLNQMNNNWGGEMQKKTKTFTQMLMQEQCELLKQKASCHQ